MDDKLISKKFRVVDIGNILFGGSYWGKNNLRYRTDGPAVEWDDGTKFWYKDGKTHRIDGPAEEWNSGRREYYLNGTKLTKEEWEEQRHGK